MWGSWHHSWPMAHRKHSAKVGCCAFAHTSSTRHQICIGSNTALSLSQLPVGSLSATLTHCREVSDGDHMTSQVSHPIFGQLLHLEVFSFCLGIKWKKISYQLISVVSASSVVSAHAEHICPFSIWQPTKYLKTALTSLLSIFVTRLNISNSFALLSHNTIPKPLTILIPLDLLQVFNGRLKICHMDYIQHSRWTGLLHRELLSTLSWYNINLLRYPRFGVTI